MIGKNSVHQREIDKVLIDLDGTENKSNIGANAILAVSIANLKVAAKSSTTIAIKGPSFDCFKSFRIDFDSLFFLSFFTAFTNT